LTDTSETKEQKADKHKKGEWKKHLRRLIIILIVVGASIAGYDYWDDNIKDRYYPRRFGVVKEGQIFRSGRIHENIIKDTLAENKIQVIVNLSSPWPPEIKAAEELGIEIKEFALAGDGTGKIENYAKAIREVERAKKQGKPVLIRCSSGSQRTGGAVAFYRLLIEGSRDNKAIIRELKKYGWGRDDVTLINYLNKNMLTMAELLKGMGVIDKIPSPVPQIYSRNVKIYDFAGQFADEDTDQSIN